MKSEKHVVLIAAAVIAGVVLYRMVRPAVSSKTVRQSKASPYGLDANR